MSKLDNDFRGVINNNKFDYSNSSELVKFLRLLYSRTGQFIFSANCLHLAQTKAGKRASVFSVNNSFFSTFTTPEFSFSMSTFRFTEFERV